MATYKCKKPYMYGTGRRKSSVARVHLIPNGTGSITINGRDIDDYFGLETLKLIVSPWSPPGPSVRSTSKPPSPAAAFPVRPAPSATVSPAPFWSSTRATAQPSSLPASSPETPE